MPSDFARKQLEKYGWKEGQGLGKEGKGVTTYVRAIKPKGERGDFIGIGHTAGQGTSNSDMGLDDVLKGIGSSTKKTTTRANSHSDGDSPSGPARKGHRAELLVPTTAPPSSSSSSSSSDSESSDDNTNEGEPQNVMAIDDATLFARCNGVRLGRGGRHRFFEHKVARIEAHNTTTTGHNPYQAPPVRGDKLSDPKKRR